MADIATKETGTLIPADKVEGTKVYNAQGEKLSKQTFAAPLPRANPVPMLWQALAFLGQLPEPEWRDATLAEFWTVARGRWSEANVPCRTGIIYGGKASAG